MNPEQWQGILQLADLQDDFVLLNYKKFRDQNRVVLVLGRRQRQGRCSGCGTESRQIHLTDRVWIRDLSAFGFQVELYVDRFTLRCERCQNNRVEVHWLWRPRRSFSWRFEKRVSRLCEEMTNAAVGRIEELNDKTVYTIDKEMEIYSGTDQVELLKGRNKWLLLTREEKLSKTNRRLLEELKAMNERIVDALLVREYFIQFFQAATLREARIRWYRLLKLVKEVDIAAFIEFFRKLKSWTAQLWNYFEHRTSSAVIEAINHKIQVTKSAAYGYKNLRYFQLKILQRCGFLNT